MPPPQPAKQDSGRTLPLAGRESGSGVPAANSVKSQGSATLQRQHDAYMSELLSYSLDRLRKEPEVLKAEKEQLERNLQGTAVSQYTAFISAAHCLDTINSGLSSVCQHLDALLQGTPELANACEVFSSNSAVVLEQYTQNKQLASSQSVILELLEVPQLMDTCVRNGIYDEALDLQAFIFRMGLLHPEVPAVRLLVQQVVDVGQTMLQQLLGRLKTSIQLPECLRIMGYLRRIAAFSEAELRLQFLACRNEWISSLVDELDDSDSYEYVKHLTDVHRLHLFDAVMQYRAIFFDAPSGGQGQEAMQQTSNLRETTMLYTWVQHRISLYMEQLKKHVPSISEGGNLASVVEHCMYCGSSLSRVGLDFQPLLQPLFEACSLQLFATHLSNAVDVFNQRLEAHRWVPLPSPIMGRPKAASDATSAATGASTSAEGGVEASGGSSSALQATASGAAAAVDDSGPPYVIMEHLPLAVYTNGALSAINELRHCALLSMSRPLAGLLQQALEHAAGSLLHYRHTHALNNTELPLFKSATRAMLEVVLPYLAAAYSRVFPGSSSKVDASGAASILRQLLSEL